MRPVLTLPHLRFAAGIGFATALCGCASPQSTQIINPRTDQSGYGMGLDERDFSATAQAAVQKLLTSGAVDRPGGGRYVIAISRITNDTMQRIDTDQLVKKIRVALLNSGKAAVTTAVSDNGPEDPMSGRIRELRESQEFNQRNVPGAHEMAAPDLSLSGKFLQHNNRVDRGQRVDYEFQLSLTDLHSGVAIWEDEEPLSKLGTNNTVAW
jgi:uncharacterized protein (TIGR02722 family)